MLLQIPAIIYDEFSEKYCAGEEKTLYLYDIGLPRGRYRVRTLKSNHQEIGFEGAIGYYEDKSFSCLALWHRMPTETDDDHYSTPDPKILINANVVETGVWAYGRGHLMEDRIWAEFPGSYGISLGMVATAFVAKILVRANELAMPIAQSEPIQFWDVESRQ